MHNIPFGMMNRICGEILEKVIGEIIEVNVDNDSAGRDPFLKVKIWVDITKPFLRGSFINYSGNPLCIAFKYERLFNFCFECGIIKHHSLGCSNSSNNYKLHDRDQSQYKIWLKATIFKKYKKGSSSNSDKKNFGSSSIDNPNGREVAVDQVAQGDH